MPEAFPADHMTKRHAATAGDERPEPEISRRAGGNSRIERLSRQLKSNLAKRRVSRDSVTPESARNPATPVGRDSGREQ
jgi:hypothetical protein